MKFVSICAAATTLEAPLTLSLLADVGGGARRLIRCLCDREGEGSSVHGVLIPPVDLEEM